MATKSTKNMIRDWVAKMIETTPPSFLRRHGQT